MLGQGPVFLCSLPLEDVADLGRNLDRCDCHTKSMTPVCWGSEGFGRCCAWDQAFMGRNPNRSKSHESLVPVG